jgi:hypothetical protein
VPWFGWDEMGATLGRKTWKVMQGGAPPVINRL